MATKTKRPTRQPRQKDHDKSILTPEEVETINQLRPDVFIGSRVTPFADLSRDFRRNTPITIRAYSFLERELAKGVDLDTALRQIGVRGGKDDEVWQRFQTMFGPQAKELERLMAGREGADVLAVRQGGRGWQSMSWHLERTKTERYGQRSKTGKMASPGTAIGAILATAKSGKK